LSQNHSIKIKPQFLKINQKFNSYSQQLELKTTNFNHIIALKLHRYAAQNN